MKIFTSSWATQLPPELQKIGISRGTPRGYPAGYRTMRELAPGEWFRTTSPAAYHRLYMAQLAALDAGEVVAKMRRLAGGKEAVALLCFEKPDDPAAWCHRGQVAGWLFDQLKIEVFEWQQHGTGCGWQHPKLLPEFRK